jgi:hypothetical protein
MVQDWLGILRLTACAVPVHLDSVKISLVLLVLGIIEVLVTSTMGR